MVSGRCHMVSVKKLYRVRKVSCGVSTVSYGVRKLLTVVKKVSCGVGRDS